MQSAVDVDERFAVARELARLALAQSLRMREAARDLAIAIDLREVVGTRDQREVDRPALARLAGFDQLDGLRRRRHFLEIVDRLFVGGKLEVRAGPESEDAVRGWNASLSTEDDGRGQ